MTFLYKANPTRGAQWAKHFATRAPELPFRIWPDIGDPKEVRYLGMWVPPENIATTFPNGQPQNTPVWITVVDGRPVRVTTDRRGFAGGAVIHCAGPWRTSGNWWAGERKLEVGSEKLEVRTSGAAGTGPWNRDEWDVSLGDGTVYRVFRDRPADRWFIDAVVD